LKVVLSCAERSIQLREESKFPAKLISKRALDSAMEKFQEAAH